MGVLTRFGSRVAPPVQYVQNAQHHFQWLLVGLGGGELTIRRRQRVLAGLGHLIIWIVFACLAVPLFGLYVALNSMALQAIDGFPLYFYLPVSFLLKLGVTVVAAAPAMAFVWMSYRSLNRGLRHFQKRATQVLDTDNRKPIVYLRSFGSDPTLSFEERALADIFRSIGPVVAIGRPEDDLPPLGVLRIYIDEHSDFANWKSVVSQLLRRAEVVVIATGETPGIGWELGECERLVHPSRLFMLVLDDSYRGNVFTRIASENSGIALPKFPNNTVAPEYSGSVRGIIRFGEGYRGEWFDLSTQPDRFLLFFMNRKSIQHKLRIDRTLRNSFALLLADLDQRLVPKRATLFWISDHVWSLGCEVIAYIVLGVIVVGYLT